MAEMLILSKGPKMYSRMVGGPEMHSRLVGGAEKHFQLVGDDGSVFPSGLRPKALL